MAKKEMNDKKIKVVKEYMSFYDDLIKKTIKKNNEEIYNSLHLYLKSTSDKLMLTASNPNNRFLSALNKSIQKELVPLGAFLCRAWGFAAGVVKEGINLPTLQNA